MEKTDRQKRLDRKIVGWALFALVCALAWGLNPGHPKVTDEEFCATWTPQSGPLTDMETVREATCEDYQAQVEQRLTHDIQACAARGLTLGPKNGECGEPLQ